MGREALINLGKSQYSSLHIEVIMLIKGTPKGADISILIANLVTLALSYLVQFGVYNNEIEVTIGLLLIRIAVVVVIILALISIMVTNSKKKIDKNEIFPQNNDE